MRKTLVFILYIAMLIFSLFSCGSPNESKEMAGDSSQEAESAEQKTLTGNVFIDAEINENVFGTSDGIHKSAYIDVKLEDATNASMEDFVEFVFSEVDNSGYDWFTVCVKGNEGICFYGASPYNAQYGIVSIADYSMYEPLGNLVFHEDSREYEYVPFEDSVNSEC